MVRVCEHKFEHEDPEHPEYSLTEVDLFPAAGERGEALSVRRCMDYGDVYQIFDFEHEEPYSRDAVEVWGNLGGIITAANRLEEEAAGSGSFEYGHSPGLYDECPEDWEF